MKRIKLTQNKYAIVDDTDYEWLNQYKWTATKRKNGIWYAMRNVWNHGQQYRIYMHRLIMGLKRGDKNIIDHINHNGLNNRRFNLRVCTHAQNSRNSKPHYDGTSKFKGVSWYEPYKKWVAYIFINGKRKTLGYFNDELNAARIYQKQAKKYFGEFAYVDPN